MPAKTLRKKQTRIGSPRSVSMLPVNPTEREKLVTAQEIESVIGLNRRALYRLASRRRVVVYRTGERGGLRFLLSEVVSAIRQPAQAVSTKAGA